MSVLVFLAVMVAGALSFLFNSRLIAILASGICLVYMIHVVAVPVYPDFGALVLFPFLVGYFIAAKAIVRKYSLLLYLAPLAWMTALVLFSPVNRGLHWGPRLMIPPIVVMTCMLFASIRPRPGLRVLVLHSLLLALLSIPVLKVRQLEMARQAEKLASIEDALITDRHALKAEFFDVLADNCVLHVWSEEDFDLSVEVVWRGGETRFSIVTEAGRPLFGLAMLYFKEYGSGFHIIDGGWLTDPLVQFDFDIGR